MATSHLGSAKADPVLQPIEKPADPARAWVELAVAVGVVGCSGGSDPQLPEAFERPQSARRSKILSAPPQPSASVAAVPTADALMDWAQRAYPDLFPGSPPSLVYEQYKYRFYEGSSNYVGVANGRVYVLGPVSGDALLDVGALADFAEQVATDYRLAKPASDEEAARFLLQAQFSATRAEIARVRALGFGAWFDQEAAAPAAVTAWDWLDQRGYTKIDQYGYYFTVYQAFYALWYQLIMTPDALRKRLALALSEYFVATFTGVGGWWRAWVVCDYWDMLADNAFGNFRVLLGKVAAHSAIGQLLTMVGSRKANPATGQVPDENFARELMQLFTIGLYELNPDGSPKLNVEGRPIETYGQSDVIALARVFTGYNLATVPINPITVDGSTLWITDISQARLPLVCDPALHDGDELRFLNITVPRGTPEQRRNAALDGLFHHPNVGPFFGRQMIQRLVTSNPSPGYVARVAAVFANNGSGVRGDLKAVFRAILLDSEARGPGGLTSPTFGKLREPMLRFAQLSRSFGLQSKAGTWKMIDFVQEPLYARSVFSFFRPGNPLPGPKPQGRSLVAPEFQIEDQVTVADYVNQIRNFTAFGRFVSAPDIPAQFLNPNDPTLIRTKAAGQDLVLQYLDELPLVPDPPALVRHLNLVLAAGQLDAASCKTIADALKAYFGSRLDALPRDVQIQLLSWAVTMVMCSPEYLIQK